MTRASIGLRISNEVASSVPGSLLVAASRPGWRVHVHRSAADRDGSAVSDDPVIPHRLYGSDFRMLACRADPDPRFGGSCSKVRVIVNGRSAYLCPLRVAAFLADATSLAGLVCASAEGDPPVADSDLP